MATYKIFLTENNNTQIFNKKLNRYFQGSNNPYLKNCIFVTVVFQIKAVVFISIIFWCPPNFFYNFVCFHPILMFLTILESGDKTNSIGDEFKTIRLIMINT
jgi:hypothetical protein